MKHCIAFSLLAVLFIGCSSNNTVATIIVDEDRYVTEDNRIVSSLEDYDLATSIFSIVPGKYDIKKIDLVKPLAYYTIDLKLRLKKKTELYKPEDFALSFPFYVVDAEEMIIADGFGAMIAYKQPDPHKNDGKLFNEDLLQDFVDFLSSNPGTERTVRIGFTATQDIRGSKGIVMNPKGSLRSRYNNPDDYYYDKQYAVFRIVE